MKECPPDEAQVSRQFLSYLSRFPGGEDTVEGIIRHVLPAEPTSRQRTLLKEVAGDLVTQGLIEKVGKGDQTGYRLRSRR